VVDRQQLATELIRTDVLGSLEQYFSPTEGFNVARPFASAEPIANDSHTAVVWEFSGIHTGDFLGIKPTRRAVVIRGVTVVDHSKEPAQFHRYVDWAEVMGQLGLSITGRPAVADPFDT
jgi:hypothetical protein